MLTVQAELSPQQKAVMVKELRDAFTSAGVGRRYHDRSLKEYGKLGSEMFDWATGATVKMDVKKGRGFCISGTDLRARDVFMLLARALVLAGLRVKIVSVPTLMREANLPDIDTSIDTAQALFVWSMFDEGYKACPFPDFAHLETSTLLSEMIDNGKAIFTLAEVPLTGLSVWWPPKLVERLRTVNREILVTSEAVQ